MYPVKGQDDAVPDNSAAFELLEKLTPEDVSFDLLRKILAKDPTQRIWIDEENRSWYTTANMPGQRLPELESTPLLPPERDWAPARMDAEFDGHKRMAYRFAELFTGQLMYTQGRGWMKWAGAYWQSCSDNEAWKAVEVTCREAIRDAAGIDDKDERNKLLSVVHKCETAAGTKSVLDFAKRWDGIGIDDNELDQKPGLFAVNNGVIDLYAGGTFRRGDPADLMTQHGFCDYDPSAQCPTYDRLLATYQPNPEIRAYLHRLGGAALEGEQNLQNLIIWYGASAGNGKGTTERAWERVFGSYTRRIQVEALLARGKFDQYKDERARLRGARLLLTTEPDDGARFSTGTVKGLTGGDPITSREVYKGSVTFKPTWLLMMSTNERVGMPSDFGMQRRIKEIPWEFQIPRESMDATVEEQLAAETSGILNRLIEGWKSYRADGIQHPQAVEESTKEYFKSVDPISRFMEECLEKGDAVDTLTKDRMYRLYVHWCHEAGERFVMTKRALGLALTKPEPQGPGMEETRLSTGRFWKGYKLSSDYYAFEAGPQQREDAR